MISSLPSFKDDPKGSLNFFKEYGFLIEKDLVSQAGCNSLIEAALCLRKNGDQSYKPIPMPHLFSDRFMDTFRSTEIVRIVETLIGGTASGIGGEFFFTKPGVPGFTLHQDNTYLEASPDATVSAWTALTDIDEQNGALKVFPRSHKLGQLPRRECQEEANPSQNPHARRYETIMPSNPKIEGVNIRLRAGSTIFLHSFLAHSSNDNSTSDRFRYAYLATYIRKGQPFRPGPLQKRSEVELHKHKDHI
jgi:ectoine hydroxylase-related dioxygenase (phytanoyl-CoA dioxygenase family)